MIKTAELRIGNWLDSSAGYIQVTPQTIELTATGIVALQPIPLTPEVLEKAGFEKSNPRGWWDKKPKADSQSMGLYMPDDGPFQYVDGAFERDLLFLHQLQNLYFALTGEELEVNL